MSEAKKRVIYNDYEPIATTARNRPDDLNEIKNNLDKLFNGSSFLVLREDGMWSVDTDLSVIFDYAFYEDKGVLYDKDGRLFAGASFAEYGNLETEIRVLTDEGYNLYQSVERAMDYSAGGAFGLSTEDKASILKTLSMESHSLPPCYAEKIMVASPQIYKDEYGYRIADHHEKGVFANEAAAKAYLEKNNLAAQETTPSLSSEAKDMRDASGELGASGDRPHSQER